MNTLWWLMALNCYLIHSSFLFISVINLFAFFSKSSDYKFKIIHVYKPHNLRYPVLLLFQMKDVKYKLSEREQHIMELKVFISTWKLQVISQTGNGNRWTNRQTQTHQNYDWDRTRQKLTHAHRCMHGQTATYSHVQSHCMAPVCHYIEMCTVNYNAI